MKRSARMAATLGMTATMLCAGCSAFRQSVTDRDPRAGEPLGAKYDQQDLLSLAESMVSAVMGHPFPAEGEKNPIVAPLGIQNRTRTHIDTEALMDTITTRMLDSGKVRIVNTARRDQLLAEQGFQLANATPETRVKIGRQLGARYMLTGAIAEIEKESGRQARLSKQQDVYYQLTLEVTDLETGLVALRKQQDRLRRASKPLIGW